MTSKTETGENELLYEAGLVAEAFADGRENAMPTPVVPGEALQLDHRRILATAVGRLRFFRGNFGGRDV